MKRATLDTATAFAVVLGGDEYATHTVDDVLAAPRKFRRYYIGQFATESEARAAAWAAIHAECDYEHVIDWPDDGHGATVGLWDDWSDCGELAYIIAVA